MISPTSNTSGFHRTDALATPAGHKSPPPQTQADHDDRLSSAHTDALRAALAHTPEIRPEVVARGRALIVDPTYPPREIIDSLAKLLAQSQDPSDHG